MKIFIFLVFSLSALSAQANWFVGMPVLTNCNQDESPALRLATIVSIQIDKKTQHALFKVQFDEKWSQSLCASEEFSLESGVNELVPYFSSQGESFNAYNIGDIVRVPYLKGMGKRQIVDISYPAGSEYIGVNIGTKKSTDSVQQFIANYFYATRYFPIDIVQPIGNQ